MNPNTMEFEPETEETPAEWSRFAVGEIVEINGIEFTISGIEKKELHLRPVKTIDRFPKAETFKQRLERKIRERAKNK